MKIDLYHHHQHEDDRETKTLLRRILDNQEAIMATLDDVLKDVADEGTALDSVAALITGLRQQVSDALSGASLPPAVQQKVDSIFTAAEANKGKIATALATNVEAPAAAASG